ncbi:hypothetical protein SEUCBS139899_004017 [Sporothrix eucalyptigena]
MKASILVFSSLLWAGPALAGPCRMTTPSPSSSVAAVSSSPAPSSSSPAAPSSSPIIPSSSSSAPITSDIVGTPASSSVPASSSSFSSVVVVVPSPPSSSSPIPSSSPAPSSFSSVIKPSSSSSSAPAPSSSSGITTNPGEPSCSTDNVFVDYDFSLGLSYWPSNVLTGSPTCSLGANCGTSSSGAAYNACLELDLVTLGSAEGIDFYQKVTVVKGTSYTGYFYYRLPQLTASGSSMATLTCSMDGVTKYSVVLCDNDTSETWKKVSFAYTADCTDAKFMCKVTTSAVTAKLQFTDFYLAAQC